VRAYVDDPVTVPHIVLWEESRWRGFPGYGWLFPGADGRANIGLGLGVLGRRGDGSRAVRALGAFVAHLRSAGVLEGSPDLGAQLGGWLKMGMVGTVPAGDRVLLVGDAAGLVNPLQGEGISQAMGSGRAAAEAILAGPGEAAARYRTFLAETYVPYQSITASLHAALLPRPLAIAAAGRLVTAPGIGRAIAGGWTIFWNDLLDGAAPGRPRRLAAAASAAGRVVSARGRTRRWFVAATGTARRPSAPHRWPASR
jgi:hypothetical protein